MNGVVFFDWEGVWGRSGLGQRRERSYGIVIRWYLGWLKARRKLAKCANARAFVEEKTAEKGAGAWMVG